MINFLRISNNIKLGDFLHSNGSIDDIASEDVIGICAIPNNLLPDKYARFISINSTMGLWSNRLRLVDNYKIDLPGLNKHRSYNFGFIKNVAAKPRIVSPYLPGTKEFNPDYLRETKGGNALQDYKGYENTGLYWTKHRKQNKYVNAFNLCSEIAPSYRKEDWYLPAIGELTFLSLESEILSKKCGDCVNKSDFFLVDRFIIGSYWSSTESSKGAVWDISLGSGCISSYYKNGKDIIRAFLIL